jgi:hypothetical protein
MLPAGTNVCFRCGNSGLIHFGGNGQAWVSRAGIICLSSYK